MADLKKICKNCSLYNKKLGVCDATIIYAGEYWEIAVSEKDDCIWESLDIPVDQIRIWTENGQTHIEYPDHILNQE